MSPYQKMSRAFQIFDRYDVEYQHVTAEHDEMWAGPVVEDVSAEDVAELESLGWTPSDEGGFHHFV